MESLLTPGTFVCHPNQPDWGIGQVQTAINGRITVNFEHAGKRVINGGMIDLQIVDPRDHASPNVDGSN